MNDNIDPMTTVAAFGDAMAKRDVDAALELFADDARIVPGNVAAMPFGGLADGQLEMRRFLAGMVEHITIVSNELDSIIVDGTTVVVFTRLTGRVAATGRSFTTDAALRFVLDDVGRIVLYQVHEDTQAVSEAFSPIDTTDLDRWTDGLHAALSAGSIDALGERWHDDITYLSPTLHSRGIAARTAAELPVLEAFSNAKVEVHRRWYDGATVIEHCTLHAAHTGELDTPLGAIPATGRVVRLDYVQALTWSDGRVVDQLISYDQAGLLHQLNATSGTDTPEPST